MIPLNRSWVRWIMGVPVVLCLSVMPWPAWCLWFRPDWAALWVIYAALWYPKGPLLTMPWVLGLMLDVVSDFPLGAHALALSLSAYLVSLLRLRVRLFPMWQQVFCVVAWLTLERLLLIWTTALLGRPVDRLDYLFSVLITALLWPICCQIGRPKMRLTNDFYSK